MKIHTASIDGKVIYSVDLIIAYINIYKPKYVYVNVSDYLDILNYGGWEGVSPKDVISNPNKYKQHMELINDADLKYPIVISNKHIIDGVHRLAKAYMLGNKKIKAYIFPLTFMKKFIIHNDMNIYEYIEHFNKKFN